MRPIARGIVGLAALLLQTACAGIAPAPPPPSTIAPVHSARLQADWSRVEGAIQATARRHGLGVLALEKADARITAQLRNIRSEPILLTVRRTTPRGAVPEPDELHVQVRYGRLGNTRGGERLLATFLEFLRKG